MTLKRAFQVLLGLILGARGLSETIDPDLWWHLRTGELVWNSGIPTHDTLSLTRQGAPWIAHEWLADLLMWLVVDSAGLGVLNLLFAAAAAVAFLLVVACSPGRPYLAGTVAVAAAVAAASSLGARPQVLNLLFLAAFVATADRVRRGVLPPPRLLLLPALTVVWVNLHSGFLLGVAVLLAFAAGEAAEILLPARRPDDTPAPSRRRVAWFAATAAACLVAALANPYGWQMWAFAPTTLGSAVIQNNIVEWLSPDFHEPRYWAFAALLFTGVTAWAAAPGRPPWTDVLLFLGTAAAGLVSRRHIALFAVVAVPIVSRALVAHLGDSRLFRSLHAADPRPLPRAASLVNLTLVAVGAIAILASAVPRLAGIEARVAQQFPVAAVDYLEREGLAGGRIFNSYGWGGYLAWRGVRPFVDGRAEVYGDFLDEYLKTFRLTADWRRPLAGHRVDAVLVERNSSLAVLLVESGEWRVTHWDDLAVVLRRGGAG